MSLLESFISALGAWFKSPNISITRAFSQTGYTNMRDVITLIDAICDVYDRNDYRPNPDGTTHCNQAVAAVAVAMGCNDFSVMNADQMVDHMTNSPDWSLVAFEKAQDLANQGSLLVAGLSATDLAEGHGHVVVIRPGKACQSGKWGATPRCVNIGKNDFIARAQTGPLSMMPVGLNDAFIPLPKIWAWRPSLG